MAAMGLTFASVPALAEVCANERFRQGPSSTLPDCRAFEMASPPNKNGGEVDNGLYLSDIPTPEQAASNGEAVTYGSTTAFLGTGADSAELASQYLSKRTSAGWQTQAITPTQEQPEGSLKPAPGQPEWSLYQGFNENLSAGFLLAWNPQPVVSAPEGYFNPYLREDENGKYRLLSSETPQAWAPGKTELWGTGFSSVYAGMSADGQHVIFEANDALTENAVPGRDNLYEWSKGRALELVSVLPVAEGGEAYADGNEYPAAELGGSLTFGGTVGGRQSSQSETPFNYSDALSSNGMRAFWTAAGKIYMHEIVGKGARTIEISTSQKTGGGAGTGKYITANPAGSLVYFISGDQLTNDSTAVPEIPRQGENPIPAKPDLYQYNVGTGELRDLTVDSNTGESAAVQGVLGSGEAESTSYVYFVANGVLGNGEEMGATPGNCLNVNVVDGSGSGSCNLYMWHDGETKFIVRLDVNVEAEETDFSDAVMARTSRVSPNGRWLAFQSERPLTGYDNIPANGPCPLPNGEAGPEASRYGYGNPDEVSSGSRYSEGRCMELFEYDALSEKLVCASCNPTGLPPTGESIIPDAPHLFNNIYGWESSTEQQRYLLDDGRLFFDSEDVLSTQATNGKQNVYEYEPEGTGGCAISGQGSCLYLISSGTSSAGSAFLDAGADGRDVFFLTREKLVPEDNDEAIDVYDAREEGGFTQAQPPPCSGEACKPAVTPAPPIYGAPSSATFEGAGNTAASVATVPVQAKAKSKTKPAACRKDHVKKKGRCVRKSKAKKASDRKRRK